jgi:ribosomal protein S18 acetylase RimI-like enzyme
MIASAQSEDAEAILALQQLAFSRFPHYLPPQQQTVASLQTQIASQLVLKASIAGRIIGSVRASLRGTTCIVERLIVHPEQQRQGVAGQLMRELESRFAGVDCFELFTGIENEQSICLYRKLGYREWQRDCKGSDQMVYMSKQQLSR